jgi:hypothetical protein
MWIYCALVNHADDYEEEIVLKSDQEFLIYDRTDGTGSLC